MSNLAGRAHRRAGLSIALALAVGLNAGCDATSDDGGESAARADGDDSSARPGGNLGASPPASMGPADASGSFGSSSGSAGSGSAAPLPGADGEGASDGSGEGDGVGVGEDAGRPDPIELEPGQLTAGEWSDLDNWSFWRDLHSGQHDCGELADCADDGIGTMMSSHWQYDTQGRVAVRVLSAGEPVVDALVELRDEDAALWSARTDSRGRAELFAGLFASSSGDYTVSVQAVGESVEVADVQPGGDAVEVDFPVAHAPAPSLDLMFMVDTTGSMGDELSYIQAELGHVIEQVRDEIGSQLQVRLSVNFYRDRGDEYLVRDFQFTSEIDQALDQLAAQSAGGGGDTPEAVEEALDNAVNDHSWSESATARLLFFVLDAPPHYDDARVQSLHDSTRAAAEKGVQIIPLAASGVDAQTEFLLRMLAISTGGTYTFLTDHSGIGNSHLAPTIGQYDVELLDDLMVRVIRERL
jgi:hypothetical protein